MYIIQLLITRIKVNLTFKRWKGLFENGASESS